VQAGLAVASLLGCRKERALAEAIAMDASAGSVAPAPSATAPGSTADPTEALDEAGHVTANNVEPSSDAESDGHVLPSWKSCARGAYFECREVSHGIAPHRAEPGLEASEFPVVCGCVPRCKTFRFLIALEANGRWPDGSRRGRFSCEKGGIPSVAPGRHDDLPRN
jgi:hypothetical protein